MSVMDVYTLLIMLLFFSLFLELPNPISVEATNFVSSSIGRVFKASLIHRDSPLSPFYNPSLTLKERLKRSPLGSISRGHNIHLSSSYYNTNKINNANNNKLFNLISDEGEYLIEFTLGTPKVKFIALVDTGSDLIWVQCSSCSPCIRNKSPLFNPTKSWTYRTIPCKSSTCSRPDVQTGCSSNNTAKSPPCLYYVSYGDGTESVGIIAKETFTLPSDTKTSSLRLHSSIIGCGYNQNGTLSGGAGIVGMGRGSSSLISQLGHRIKYKFSYCLTPSSSNIDSKLALGADITCSGKVSSTPLATGGGSDDFYTVTLDGISISSRDNNNYSPVQVPKSFQIIVDSGTTLTFLPTSVYISLRDALASAIKVSTVPSPQEPYDLCYKSRAQFNPPDVVFHFRGVADVVLKAINTFTDMGDGITCLAMIAVDDNFILGNIAQVNFQVGFDLTAKQLLSFVPTDCTKF